MSHLEEGTLHALLDGEIGSGDLAAIEQHLGSCLACQAALAEARDFRETAFGLVETLDPRTSAAPAAVTPLNTGRSRAFSRWIRPMAWAATAVLAVGLGYSLGWQRAQPPAVDAVVAAVNPAESNAAPDPSTAPEPSGATESTRGARESAPPRMAKTSTQPEAKSRGNTPPPTVPADREVDQARQEAPSDTDAAAFRTDSKKAAADERRAERPAPQPLVAPGTPAATPPGAAVAGRARAERIALEEAATTSSSGRPRVIRDSTPSRRVDGVIVTPPSRAREIVAGTAISLLGGSIRLIDGMEPYRYEAAGSVVRVLYRSGYGVVALEQWREDNVLTWQLVVPMSAPLDSLSSWEERVR